MDKGTAQTASTLSTANLRALDGEVIGSFRGEDYYIYTEDIQGSTGKILDDSLSTKNTYSYTDFGEVTVTGDSSIQNEICYTGAIYDETTGLHYLNARYYDPENGRFISQDTYRGDKNEISQWHLYAYCANNPINYTDPSGHWVWSVVGGIIVGTVAYKLGKAYGLSGWNLACCTAVGGAIGAIVGNMLTPLLKPILHVFRNPKKAIGIVSKKGKFKLMIHGNHHGKGYHIVVQQFKKKNLRNVFEKGFYKPK